MSKHTIAILFSRNMQEIVFDAETLAALGKTFDVRFSKGTDKVGADEAAELLAGADGCMTCWGSPQLDAGLLERAPRLKIVAHSAGTVKTFVSDALWSRGIVVTSASPAIAVDVAHYTIALMVIGRKNLMEISGPTGAGEWKRGKPHRPPDDLRGCTVGIIGASHIGRLVISLLRHFGAQVLLHDPFVDAARAKELGARKAELDKIFRVSDVVSVHAPQLPSTKHMVTKERLAMMKDGATFINTSRGSLIDEAALVAELKKKRIWAFLDVTDPEPPPPGSPLLSCPNLTLSPHIAGSIGRGRKRLGAQAFEELRRFFASEPLLYPVTREMLERIA